MAQLILKPGKQKSLLRFHPWIFSGAVAQIVGSPANGETVEVLDADRKFLAWAAFSSASQIQARVWSWNKDESIDAGFFEKKLKRAIALRPAVTSDGAARLVFAESDGLPGLVVDRYAETVVIQFLSAGAEAWREAITQLIAELTGAKTVYERSDMEARRLEGLPERSGWLWGETLGEAVRFTENGLTFEVDIEHGQKTGFYLDQRANRLRLRQLAHGRDALDCFCYSGGFSANLMAGGAKSLVAVDSSGPALAQARKHFELNRMDPETVDWREADVFRFLREMRDRNRSFDLIVLDPPKFAHTASQVEKASRAYKDINLLALKLLRPGGYLATFSCSGSIDPDLFQKIVAGAAVDAGVEAQIVEHFNQAPDHPVLLFYPEAAYLKGLMLQVP